MHRALRNLHTLNVSTLSVDMDTLEEGLEIDDCWLRQWCAQAGLGGWVGVLALVGGAAAPGE